MTDDDQSAYRRTRDFLQDDPEADTALEALLAVDANHETWTFDDVDLDSGTFGEVVSRGLVEKVDGEYRLVDSEAVRAGLDGDEPTSVSTTDETRSLWDFDFDTPTVAGLVGALLVVVATRLLQFQSVFQAGRVVSPGNDQYRYRYWLERLLEDSTGPFDFSVVAGAPWGEYAQSWNERPLTHATNWFVAELLGGDQWAADATAAWLPIVMTIVLALVVYQLAIRLTDDARVGIASVLVIALAPVHAVYTQLGWLGNRSHQYLWFVVVLFSLVWLATDISRRRADAGDSDGTSAHLRSRHTWAVAGTLGLGLGLWTHTWTGSASLFVPLLGYVWLRVAMDVRADVSPGLANLPLVAGVGLSAGLAVLLHVVWDWHGLLAIGAAVLGFVGTVVLVGSGELWRRLDRSSGGLLVAQVGLGLVGVGVLFAVQPEFVQIVRGLGESVLSFGGQSTQSRSLFSMEYLAIFGPLVQIGLPFYLGVAAVGWCVLTVRRQYDPGWLAISVFALYYILASAVMVRFAGKLVIVLAVPAALAIVSVLSAVDLAGRPRVFASDDGSRGRSRVESISFPASWQTCGYVAIVGLLVFGFNLIYLPSLTGQVAHDEAHVEAAMAIADHAEQTDRAYPENHVFAPWAEYRMYNYFVSGESESERLGRYGYDNMYSFTNTDELVSYLDGHAGYVVVDTSVESPERSVHSYLIENSRADGGEDDLDRFSLVHTSTDNEVLIYAVNQ